MVMRYDICPVTGKRSFDDEALARKALGKAQTYRRRRHQRSAGVPSLRGLESMESRIYFCSHCEGFELTSASKRRRVEV